VNPHAALVFHWDHLHRQARIEGTVRKADATDSDRYFASRARDSQLGAHASQQSEPVASRAALRTQLDEVRERYGETGVVPRPDHWGIFEVRADAVELWVEGDARLHDRARWTRGAPGASHSQAWTVTRLQP
jgi:pyridoxamine 5'-phosphate oxidase